MRLLGHLAQTEDQANIVLDFLQFPSPKIQRAALSVSSNLFKFKNCNILDRIVAILDDKNTDQKTFGVALEALIRYKTETDSPTTTNPVTPLVIQKILEFVQSVGNR